LQHFGGGGGNSDGDGVVVVMIMVGGDRLAVVCESFGRDGESE